MKLSDLKINESLKVTSINASSDIKHKLNDLGITKGVIITLTGISPLGRSISYLFKGLSFSDRKIIAILYRW